MIKSVTKKLKTLYTVTKQYKEKKSIAYKNNLLREENKMASVFDVANWFLSKEPMTQKKLQKLCYYYKAWRYALYKEDVIPKYEFQAWVHGPANPELYKKYKSYGWQDIEQNSGDLKNFTEKELYLLESVWLTYGNKCANELEAIVHSEEPWIIARRGHDEGQPCTEVIDKNIMQRYYATEFEVLNKN